LFNQRISLDNVLNFDIEEKNRFLKLTHYGKKMVAFDLFLREK